MLLLCDRLGIDDEVKSLCAKSVAAKAERGAQKPIVPAQLLRLRYTLDDSMVALSTIISGVRKWLPAETPIANMDKVRGYRDSLDLPECVTVETTSTLGEASSTARAMRIADCLKAGLAQSAFVQAMDWEGLGEDIHLIFGIDGANMTVARCGLSMCCRPRFPLSTCRAANRACVSASTVVYQQSSISKTPVSSWGPDSGRALVCVQVPRARVCGLPQSAPDPPRPGWCFHHVHRGARGEEEGASSSHSRADGRHAGTC